MKNFWLLALVGCLSASWFAGAGDVPADVKFLQGSWSGSFMEFGGKAPADDDKGVRISLTIVGETYKVYEDKELLMTGRIKLDPTQSPKTIDTTYSEGPLKGMVQKGVYEIKGDEFFTNFAKPGDERPKSIKTRPKSEDVLVRYQRVKN